MMQLLGIRGGSSRDRGGSPGSVPRSPSQSPSSTSSTPNTLGPARPLRLVYSDEGGKFRMDPEAVAALQLVKGPIGVVSVCGRARQGKSFILNQLLGRSSGFQVASSQRPCTRGLWITQIFSLAVLLSSMFVYNQSLRGRSTVSEIGQFSPVFVWLLRDFYLELSEGNQKITPRDYLELALRPVQGLGKDLSSKNEIRESIRTLFPDRECFALVRPLNNESDLQRLDQIPLDKLRPEFRSGLDALTKFVFERTRPKQIGATIMTGPILAGITQSFLDAINKGAVPTISSSWQVHRSRMPWAYDTAAEVYMTSFDRTKPAEDAGLREAHEDAIEKSLAAFNAGAVGLGSARMKYEKLLHNFYKKAFEVLDNLLTEYESSSHGPGKWKKLAAFLQQCLSKALELMKRESSDWKTKYDNSCLELKVVEEKFTAQIAALESRRSIAEGRLSAAREQAKSAEEEASEWKWKYDAAAGELKTALEKATLAQKRSNKEVQNREDALRAEFSNLLTRKEEEIKSLIAKFDNAEKQSINLASQLKAAESKLKNHEVETLALKDEIKELNEKLEFAKTTVLSHEREARMLEQEKNHLQEKFILECKKFDEADERCRAAERDSKRAIELADTAFVLKWLLYKRRKM
ncbi:hypothetical protein J5N97_001321 [Dioscorea zingiberensis]|uniref:GB1/RHD3-type G domain-containing protein n=1 Tax=Dioscorea zingiberensis TaxID=325984 RepID=A0A9D5BVV5_9LILI|nr:hypothetical protein J5N97_001321 [Dioscorea zingiberensis]